LKKAKGAGICPSTGTGTAFLPIRSYGVRNGDFSAILTIENKNMEKGQDMELRWST
jgi:hypothetical protein